MVKSSDVFLIAESISDHMYRMSVIAMLCPPEHKVDKDRCIKLAIVHDMAEALVGDITPPDKIEKGRRHFPGITRVFKTDVKPSRKTPTRAPIHAVHS